MVNDSRNLLFAMGVNIGLLWMSPESFSNFDKDKIREQSIFENWKDNVTRKPVMDKDGKLLNYVLHPLSGAIYYSIARSNGMNRWESFGYSVMMSTFFWEYGIEATVERPSIQDLIATPVLGSILGEVGFYLAKKIENNGGKVLGSRKVGKLLMIILRPGESLVHGINKLLKKRAVQNAESQIVLARVKDPTRPGLKTNYIGLQLGFQF